MLLNFLETECTTEQRTQFLRFATGRIALSGQEGHGWLSVQVVDSWSPERLPEPHTCIPRMDLAPHVSQQQLNSKMRQVVRFVSRTLFFCFVTRHGSGDCRDSWRRHVCHIAWCSCQRGCAAEQKQFKHQEYRRWLWHLRQGYFTAVVCAAAAAAAVAVVAAEVVAAACSSCSS